MLERLAVETEGYSGADLENIVNESAYICIQNGRDVIQDRDIEEAFVKIRSQHKVSYF